MIKRCFLALAIVATVPIASVGLARQGAVPESRVDAVLSRWGATTPGCAVGVSRHGKNVLEKAYGMAELEHDVPIRPDTIFEAGSVAKQFTAAAILLLAREGKLSLDDQAREYVPELPDYGAPLTIRQMLNHTSGLRDWGSVVAIAGWPRGTRVHNHAHVLDVVSRQRSLNFPSGTRYSYSNTGYNLAAVIVSRVSGQPFAEFTRTRIFTPLGMSRTSWRDDHTRVVKGRAIAYSGGPGGFSIQMPFENIHGNGGLLTTVGDLLRWTRNFSQPVVGDAALVKELQTPGRFNDGRPHGYALELFVGTYQGVREVSHSGATAGYRAWLSEYPDRELAVAVLCNVSSGNATQYAHAIADVYLGPPNAPDTTSTADRVGSNGSAPARQSTSPPGALAGMYRRTDTGEPLTVLAVSRADVGLLMNELRIEGGPPLTARSSTRFVAATAAAPAYDFSADGLKVTDSFGSVEVYVRVRRDEHGERPVAEYAGTYVSDEAETTLTAAADGKTLVLKRRPDDVIRLTPLYRDAFRGPIGFVRFHRDNADRITSLSVTQDRVWELRFQRR
jgi:CubicO group peptidase (beta-lactamase class C family)